MSTVYLSIIKKYIYIFVFFNFLYKATIRRAHKPKVWSIESTIYHTQFNANLMRTTICYSTRISTEITFVQKKFFFKSGVLTTPVDSLRPRHIQIPKCGGGYRHRWQSVVYRLDILDQIERRDAVGQRAPKVERPLQPQLHPNEKAKCRGVCVCAVAWRQGSLPS